MGHEEKAYTYALPLNSKVQVVPLRPVTNTLRTPTVIDASVFPMML